MRRPRSAAPFMGHLHAWNSGSPRNWSRLSAPPVCWTRRTGGKTRRCEGRPAQRRAIAGVVAAAGAGSLSGRMARAFGGYARHRRRLHVRGRAVEPARRDLRRSRRADRNELAPRSVRARCISSPCSWCSAGWCSRWRRGPATRAAEPAALAVRERVGAFLRASGLVGVGPGPAVRCRVAVPRSRADKRTSDCRRGWQRCAPIGPDETVFGRVWVWRFVLAVALGADVRCRRLDARAPPETRGMGRVSVAASYLASLALVGHSAAGSAPTTTSRLPLIRCTWWLPARGSARFRGLPCCLHQLARVDAAAVVRGRRGGEEILGRSASRASARCCIRSGQRVVPGRRRAGAVRHALRSAAGRKDRLFATMVALAADQSPAS